MEPGGEPSAQFFEQHSPICHGYHDIVDLFVLPQGKSITAPLDHHERDYQGRALVSVDKSMVLDQGVQQGCGLSVDCAMISGVWSSNRGLNCAKADNARPSAVG